MQPAHDESTLSAHSFVFSPLLVGWLLDSLQVHLHARLLHLRLERVHLRRPPRELCPHRAWTFPLNAASFAFHPGGSTLDLSRFDLLLIWPIRHLFLTVAQGRRKDTWIKEYACESFNLNVPTSVESGLMFDTDTLLGVSRGNGYGPCSCR